MATDADGLLTAAGLGSQGLFLALIVAIISTEIFRRLAGNPRLVINMPDGVPPAVSRSFAALFPSNDHCFDLCIVHSNLPSIRRIKFGSIFL